MMNRQTKQSRRRKIERERTGCVCFPQGYTVRSSAGYRYTTYVPYSLETFVGDWTAPLGDEELYDYNIDKWETTSFADHGNYTEIKAELRAVLLKQYTEK